VILYFDGQNTGSASLSQSITLKNTRDAPMTITSIAVGSDFAQTNDCPLDPETLAVDGVCTIDVLFRPTGTGLRGDVLTVATAAAGSYTADLIGEAWKVYLPLIVAAP